MLANIDSMATAIPEFVAGFVFEMTGNNHLDEIKNCFQGGEVIE